MNSAFDNVFQTNFATIDWIILTAYILIIFSIGVILKKYMKGIGDFIVAGRNLRIFLAVAALTGSEIGLVTVMYNAEMGVKNGFSAFHIGVIEAGVLLGVGLTGFIIYKLRETNVMTIPEYYGKRYGQKVRWVGGLILAVSGILNMGLFLQAGSRFMIGVTGLGADDVVVKIVMSVMLIMVLIYTALGGMVSIVICDFLQFVVLTIGMGIVTFFTIRTIGWHNLFSLHPATGHGAGWFNPLAQQNMGIDYILWMFLVSLSGAVLWQTGITRALATKSPRIAQRMYGIYSISALARRVFPMLWGIAALIFIYQFPNLKTAFFPETGAGISAQYAFPIFIAKIVPSGLIGLITAGMMAAFMSTHDSYLLSWSSVLTQDIVAPLFKKGISDNARLLIARGSIVLIGIYLLIWGLWFEAPTSLWNYMAITATIYFAGAFSIIVAGFYWKRASSKGAMASLLSGLFAVFGILNWRQMGAPGWISEKSIALFTFALSFLAMIVVSLLFPDNNAGKNRENY